jgi:hypothetical protein
MAHLRVRAVSEDNEHNAVRSPRAEYLEPSAKWDEMVRRYENDCISLPTLDEATLMFGFGSSANVISREGDE